MNMEEIIDDVGVAKRKDKPGNNPRPNAIYRKSYEFYDTICKYLTCAQKLTITSQLSLPWHVKN